MVVLSFFYFQEIKLNQEYRDDIANTLASSISSNMTNIERAGYAVSYNDSLKQLYTSNPSFTYNTTNIYSLFQYIYNNNQGEILDVSVIDLDGIAKTFVMGIDESLISELKSIYNFSDPKNVTRKFVFFDSNSEFSQNYYAYIVPLFGSYNFNKEDNSKIASIIFINDLTSIKNQINLINTTSAIIYLTDKNNNIIYANHKDYSKQSYLYNINEKYKNSFVTKKLSNSNLKITVISNNELRKTSEVVLLYIFALVIIVIGAFIITFLFVNKHIVKPMKHLKTAIDEVEINGISHRLTINETDVVEYVSHWINKMLDNLEKQTIENEQIQNKIHAIEIIKNQAELYSLRSQINPHFLYNTLQCIRSIALMNDVNDVPDICTSLVEIFQYSIKGSNITSLKNEIHIIERYLSILNIRFEEKFKFSINIDPNTLNININKMILQPLVENSINHGFVNHSDIMFISLKSYIDGDLLVIQVDDNGNGISEKRLIEINELLDNYQFDNLQDSNALATRNINKRIKMNFGEKYGLRLYNQSKGVRSQIILPLTYNQIDEEK
jgi:two-component system sensor histidine kinase YesM